jgi:hypothetical protein
VFWVVVPHVRYSGMHVYLLDQKIIVTTRS